ncbi:hypothetical protein O181_108338 [Austropuccinia psidii MF-1]|uniref:Uncharacterized protein n=1 Tax=Austropuccinia psidii MF-1 TaxID=1389203 RepID=A0A9Q3PNR7_9BASI|nr:hypothetical protein [Austropuccinia psidii MF-1]
MAFLGHLGPLRPLWSVGHNHGPLSMGHLGPFLPNPMRPKGEAPSSQGQVGPKPQLGPPEPVLAPNLIKTKMVINHHRTHFGPGSSWTNFQPMASSNHQISSAQSSPSP